MSWLLIFILAGYTLLILALFLGNFSLRESPPHNLEDEIRFSICIPFRNEAENLDALLQSLSRINYRKSHFEIILVNDASTDGSVQVIDGFLKDSPTLRDNIRIIDTVRRSPSPKKDALAVAISQARYNWILTTDADCTVLPGWLRALNGYILSTRKTFVAAPVAYQVRGKGFFEAFQQLDFLGLQGATMGGFGLGAPFMCNGANIAFAKAEFVHLKGYTGNDTLASGDDVFLLHKFIKEDPQKVGYLKAKTAIVSTAPQHSLKNLVNQRKRWAAKAVGYGNPFAQVLSWIVLLANIAFVSAIFVCFGDLRLCLLLLAKITADLMLIAQAAFFFGKRKALWNYGISMLIYPIFVLFIAVLGPIGGYSWKGRFFRR